jgi:hypothetical protein
MEVVTVTQLPLEMLEGILRLLPLKDLKVAVEVCRRWREAGEAPGLWASVRLRVTAGSLPSMAGLLGSRRLRAVRRLQVVDSSLLVTEELMQAVVDHPGLEELDMPRGINLTRIRAELLARAVVGLEVVAMQGATVTRRQAKLVSAAVRDGPRLKGLHSSQHPRLATVWF